MEVLSLCFSPLGLWRTPTDPAPTTPRTLPWSTQSASTARTELSKKCQRPKHAKVAWVQDKSRDAPSEHYIQIVVIDTDPPHDPRLIRGKHALFSHKCSWYSRWNHRRNDALVRKTVRNVQLHVAWTESQPKTWKETWSWWPGVRNRTTTSLQTKIQLRQLDCLQSFDEIEVVLTMCTASVSKASRSQFTAAKTSLICALPPTPCPSRH